MNKTTCQICERDIKANTGVIAHHGYQRPYLEGYQTSSCQGARELPYEASCDLIPPVIESLKQARKGLEEYLHEIKTAPPEVLRKETRNIYTGQMTTEEFTRPKDFDPESTHGYYEGYAQRYRQVVYEVERNIKYTTEDIERLTLRVKNWVKLI